MIEQNGNVEQKTHYYPFGEAFEQTNESVQPFKYNGKELDNTFGINLYDYSARQMNPALGRFTTMDPLAEKYYSISPYTYCANNPMRYVDPTGMVIEDPEKNRPKGLRKYVDLFFAFILHKTGFHPSQMNSEDRAIQEDANQRREQTIETLHTVNKTMLSVVPSGEVAYKAVMEQEITEGDVAWTVAEIIPAGIVTKGGRIAANTGKSIFNFSAKAAIFNIVQ